MNGSVNPDDYIITRKRKKYKFAKFANAKNCFEFEDWFRRPVDTIELGAGTGLFSLELAARHPEQTFVAIDVKADRLQKGAYEALERGIENIFFLRARADQIDQLFETHSIASIWLTFPDPFPRDRSSRRRMTHPIYLEKYESLLRPSGVFYLKHDNDMFFNWSLEQFVLQGWTLKSLSFDLHESDLSDDYKILTTYEKRWISEGLTSKFVGASPPSSTSRSK